MSPSIEKSKTAAGKVKALVVVVLAIKSIKFPQSRLSHSYVG
jgi:hypothetical protein